MLALLSNLLLQMDALLHATLVAATPLLLAALSETVVQRTGVINIGLEGILLTGAFAGAVGAYFTDSVIVGLCLGSLSGVSLALLYALLTQWFQSDQIVVGISLNLLAVGLTGTLYRGLFGVTGQAIIVPTVPPVPLPLLHTLPIIGPGLFHHTTLVYLAILLVPLAHIFLFHTGTGLQVRAVGEYPKAAETLGISVVRVRTIALVVEGLLGGLAGAYLSLAYANTFIEGMSAGRGFITLAIVIFGRWRPLGICAGALFFGAVTALQFHLQALGSSIPYQLILMLPYLLTLLALAFSGTRLSPPAALGQPYRRD